MTAQVTYMTHTDVLNEDTTETATVVMKKYSRAKCKAGLISLLRM